MLDKKNIENTRLEISQATTNHEIAVEMNGSKCLRRRCLLYERIPKKASVTMLASTAAPPMYIQINVVIKVMCLLTNDHEVTHRRPVALTA